jgi:hypothetical protein
MKPDAAARFLALAARRLAFTTTSLHVAEQNDEF